MQRVGWAVLFPVVVALGCSADERPAAVVTRRPSKAATSALRTRPEPPASPAPSTVLDADPTRQRAEAFVALQRRLAKFSADDDLSLPAGARPLLKALKRAGRDVIEARLSELLEARSRGEKLPEKLGTAALEPFERAGAVMGDHENRPPIGSLDVISLRKLPGNDQLFAATLGLGLPCGYDEALFVFRYRADARVEHVLTASSDDYATIADGQLALEYAVSPRDEQGGFYVVTAHATPWCSSLWRKLTYRAYAPSADPERPKVLVSGESSVWIGEGLAELEAERDRFELRFVGWDRVRAGVTGEHRLAFERRGEKFVRARIKDVN